MIKIEDIQIRLREAITTSGLTQNEIATKLGVHQTAISKYLKENTFPSLETFANLCQILDVSSDEILGIK